MRRMLVSLSSFEKPRPLERLVRTSSPSRTSTWTPRAESSAESMAASVLLPAPLNPVNQTTKPDDMRKLLTYATVRLEQRPLTRQVHPTEPRCAGSTHELRCRGFNPPP